MFNIFYVIDEENSTSMDEDGNAECFGNKDAAIERAKVLASEHPGEKFAVTQELLTVKCTVSDPILNMGAPPKSAEGA